MAIGHVSRSTPAGSTASASTVASTATAHTVGNLLVALITRNGSTAVSSVADTAVSTWHHAGTIAPGAGNSLDIYYAYNTPGNAANVVTVTFAGACIYRGIVVHEFSGFGTSDPFNAQAASSGSSAALTSTSVTVSGSSAVIVGLFLDSGAGITDTVPAYNTAPWAVSGDPVQYFADGYRIVSASDAAVASGANSTWVVTAAAFQIVAAAPPLTYAQLMAMPNAEFVVTSDVQIRQRLNGWTSAGSGACSIPYSDYTHPTTVRKDRGLYRGIDSVLEQQSPYTLRASLAAVQANVGSYFFDVAAQTLYVKTFTGVNPDTINFLSAVFTICLSTHPRAFVGGRRYAALLDGQGIPQLHAEQGDFLAGVTVSPSGTLSAINADGLFDYMAAAYLWVNGSVTIRVGGGPLDISLYQVLTTMVITQSPAAGDETCVLTLRSLTDALATAFPVQTYDQAANAGLSFLALPAAVAASELTGQYMPIVFGTVYGVPLQRLDIVGVTDASYTVCNAFCPLSGVSSVLGYGNASGMTVLGGRRRDKTTGAITEFTAGEILAYSFATTTGNVKVTNAYSPDDYDFFVDLQVTWLTFTAQTVGTLLHLVLNLAGIPDAAIDLTALAAADVAAPQVRGLYIPGGQAPQCLQAASQVIDQLRTLEAIYLNTLAQWTCKVWDPSFDLATLPRITDRDILSWTPNDTPSQPVASKVSVQYRLGADSSKTTTASSTEAVSLMQQAKTFGPVTSPFVDDDDAAQYAHRLLLCAQQPPVEIDVELGPAFMTVQLADKARVVRQRGPSTGTAGFDQVMEVIGFTKDPAKPIVQVRLSNMRGLGESIRRIAPPGTPAWGSATADQKRQYLFAVDDTQQRASAGDAASFRPGVWW